MSALRHPLLPTGYNSWMIDGDEVDGAGVNEPIWPTLFFTFQPMEVMIMTAEMLDVFETGCADVIISCQPNRIVFGPEVRTLVIKQRAA
jgi:hypothetical protein